MRNSFVGNSPGDGVLLAEHQGWSLFDLSAEAGWRNLKLVTAGRGVKANFWIAHNGRCFAGGKDFILLTEHYPEIVGWVESVLKASHV